MVIGESAPPTGPGQVTSGPPGVLQDKIDNIMGGISNTGAVKMNNHRKKLRQRFDIIKKLGQGTYGKVQLGINKETGQEVAIKTIKKCKIEAESDLIRIRREVQIMSSVQHPNIIHIYEVFENREKMVLVMEFAAGGELYDYLSERKILQEDEARRIFRQVSTAVYYCHKHKICHRDLKLENILLDEHGNAKIADFGLSNVFDEQRLLSTYCGSPLYASPEIVKGTPYQGPEVDCWSLGVLLYTLVYGAMPFDGSQFKRLVKQISQGDYYEPKKPSPASPLIREMLTVCPLRRANIEQICSHWWVNEGYSDSCLVIAEDLANQTPVRLDVLLSLTPPSVTADQLVVPSGEEVKSNVPRSHSVGSIIDIGNTEAERRILDMVAAGGEAALMPSPTRTITPNESPVQPKRKLENTVSTENAVGIVKKKDRPGEEEIPQEEMEVDVDEDPGMQVVPSKTNIHEDLGESTSPPEEKSNKSAAKEEGIVPHQRTASKLDAVKEAEEISANQELSPTKVIKKFVNKHKTADLVAAVSKISDEKNEEMQRSQASAERKTSLSDESVAQTPARRRSRILETAEKFQNLSNSTSDKPKKFVIPGNSVNNFKKQFEPRAPSSAESSTSPQASAEKEMHSNEAAAEQAEAEEARTLNESQSGLNQNELSESESKTSVESFSLKEARRSMENSIALLNQAKEESSKEVEQLCAKTENIVVTEPIMDREKKLKNAREIIGNAIGPAGRLCMGVRKPPVPFGINGRSISGSVVPPMTEKKTVRVQEQPEEPVKATNKATTARIEGSPPPSTTKTSRAEITLKSATLPRRKPAKTEIQLEIKPRSTEQTMRFSTEMQHQVPDLRSAPVCEGPYSPISTTTHQRATSLEPTSRERVIPIQRPSAYVRSGSNSYRSGSLSRQSTIESDTDTTPGGASQSTITTGSSQPIKKSPREFIIPIAVEGGGFVTPRAGSLEPSDSSHTTSSAFSRINRARRVGSLLTEEESGDDGSFHKIRTPSINTPSIDDDAPRFTMHRLRSTRPIKKLSQDTNDSQSSGEDDDEDGFEILTAENLFSTLLQRVRALTNRLNVNNDLTAGFSNSSRLLGNMRQPHTPFWQQEPFGRSQFSYSYKSETVERKLLNSNSGAGAAWRHSFSRDLGSDIDSMFSRTGATLPRGSKKEKAQPKQSKDKSKEVALDLADLDLSRLRLTKKDLETLSTITPNLPKCFQEQLLAKLPPTQARKLSRTLSMQNNSESGSGPSRVYKRSLSGGRELSSEKQVNSGDLSLGFEKDRKKEAADKSEVSSSSYDRSLDTNRKSSSRGDKYGCEVAAKSRSSSTCKSGDDFSRSFCSSYTSDVSDRYKYYSPYLTKRSEPERPISPFYDKDSSDVDRSISPYKYFDGSSSPRNLCFSPVGEVYGRPPSGCLSPPPIISDGSLRRRSSQRRISRFLRPDFFDTPINEDNAYLREKRSREKEAQSVLREIREKSRERSRDRRNHSVERALSPEEKKVEKLERPVSMHHVRNKSVDRFIETSSKETDELLSQRRRRSVSRPRDIVEQNVANAILQPKSSTKEERSADERRLRSFSKSRESAERILERLDNSEIANKILEELRNMTLQSDVTTHTSNKETKTVASPAEEEAKDKVIKAKKIKLKDPSVKKEKKSSPPAKDGNSSEKQLEAKAGSEEKTKRESKLMRPKSYPIKDPEKLSYVKIEDVSPSPETKPHPPTEIQKERKSPDDDKEKSRISRPKSYPNSKITPPKDFKKFSRSGLGISAVMEKLMEKAEKPEKSVAIKKASSKSSSSEERQMGSKSSDSSTITEQKPTKKVVKKKVVKPSPEEIPSPVESPSVSCESPKKEKSPEKKVSKGLLYAIGQKFKNLQENARNREKKTATTIASTSEEAPSQNADISVTVVLKKKSKSGATLELQSQSPEKQVEKLAKSEDKTAKPDRRSRIDSMIRSLRERSVPRAPPVMTESGLIKRAVSVEDMSGAFNKCGVNKVLGLFKKYEKDGIERKVMNTRSTSNIERHIVNAYTSKDRPKSGGFMGKLKRNTAGNSVDSSKDVSASNAVKEADGNVTKSRNVISGPLVIKDTHLSRETCQDCVQELKMEARKRNIAKIDTGEQEKSKEKRKGLLLDFSKLDNLNGKGRSVANNNPPGSFSPLSFGIINNNNSFIVNNGEINQNSLLTPSNENMTNYSSSSKSPQDDCPSSSTFLSPSEEPELCFDNWSVCSEDNYAVSTPSPTVSRLSRASQLSSPVPIDTNNPESMIDRIKRRSFYCRFNEKKPKRQSNIVGPAARDYYRESAAKLRSRPPDRISSPEIDPAANAIITPDYLRPLKLSTNVNDLKPPLVQIRRRYDDDLKHLNSTGSANSSDYLKPRTTYNDLLPPTVLSKRYTDGDPVRRYEPSYSSSLYNTYNPKRRSSYTSNGILPGSASASSSDRLNNVDNYATLGRLLTTSTSSTAKSPSVGAFRREYQRTTSDFGNHPKSNLNIRNSSRSPTNI